MMLARASRRSTLALRTSITTSRSCYHSYEHEELPPYPEIETKILSKAMDHVPAHGFTARALANGFQDTGYLDISTNLFPKGVFELIRYHLVTQRLALGQRVQFGEGQQGVGSKVRSLVLARLRGNVEAGTVQHWQAALGTMSLLENISASVSELGKLSDEMWFLSGDVSVDTSWYTKRASLSGVYAATELYQTQDQSTEYRDTEAFLDRRLEDVRVVGSSVGNTIQWAGFQAGSVINLLRSKGVRT